MRKSTKAQNKGKSTKAQGKKTQSTKEEQVAPTVPQWAIQPYLYQSLILQWFETMYAGVKELHAVLERIEEKMGEE